MGVGIFAYLKRIFLAHTLPNDHSASGVNKENTLGNINLLIITVLQMWGTVGKAWSKLRGNVFLIYIRHCDALLMIIFNNFTSFIYVLCIFIILDHYFCKLILSCVTTELLISSLLYILRQNI